MLPDYYSFFGPVFAIVGVAIMEWGATKHTRKHQNDCTLVALIFIAAGILLTAAVWYANHNLRSS
jgi:hypothetical protein